MDPMVGMMIAWPLSWDSEGWMLCNGQLLQIAQYQALFSLLGTTYGGDGRTTFALLDLRGRVILGSGQHPGGNNHPLGMTGGQETVVLSANNLLGHTHPATFSGTGGGPLSVTVQASSNTAGNTAAPSNTNDLLAASPAAW